MNQGGGGLMYSPVISRPKLMYRPVMSRPIWALDFNLITWLIPFPSPNLMLPLSPLNKRSSSVHTTRAYWVIPGQLFPEKGSHCSILQSFGCSAVPWEYRYRAYPLRWEVVPMPLLPYSTKHPLSNHNIGPISPLTLRVIMILPLI